MLLRGSTFITGVLNAGTAAEPRWRFGAKTVQIYAPGGMWWSKKALIIRNAPYTIESPHPGQIEVRVRFGEIAREHKGERGFKEGLPIIAWHIKDKLTGFKAPHRMKPEDYPSRKFRTVHTLDELKAKLREIETRAKAVATAKE
jgi:hypothetical protein